MEGALNRTPATRAGKSVHAFIAHDTVQTGAGLLLRFRSSMRIASYALQISVRRRFVHEPDLSAVSAYASDFCERRQIVDHKGISDAKAAIELPLAGITLTQRPQVGQKPKVALQLLLDIVRSQSTKDAYIADLVATAEAADLIARDRAVPMVGSPGPFPTSLMGQKLRAIVRHDYVTRGRLPARSSGEDDAKLIDFTFTLLVAERFRNARTDMQIGLLAASVSELARTHTVDATDVEAVIRHELGAGLGGPPETPSLHAVKLSTMTKIVSDLGMFGGEVDTLLARAETIAAAQGLRLVQLT